MFTPRWSIIFFILWIFDETIAQTVLGFTHDFQDFLMEVYGQTTLERLERRDFPWGSFGGRNYAGQPINNQPVLMIHGVATTAGRFLQHRKYLLTKGYTDAEIYATTWGKGPSGGVIFVQLECYHIKQIRTMIEAVKMYTMAPKIDIIAFSMGAPMTRKAILGGDCNGIDLGKPLTKWIDTFVSVAGANFGSSICSYIPWGICNLNNGLSCNSHMLRELNTRLVKYEGDHSFAIITTNDDKVGRSCCGKQCASLPHSEIEFTYDGPTHDNILYDSMQLQYELITEHEGSISYLKIEDIPNPPPIPKAPKKLVKGVPIDSAMEIDFRRAVRNFDEKIAVRKIRKRMRKKRRRHLSETGSKRKRSKRMEIKQKDKKTKKRMKMIKATDEVDTKETSGTIWNKQENGSVKIKNVSKKPTTSTRRSKIISKKGAKFKKHRKARMLTSRKPSRIKKSKFNGFKSAADLHRGKMNNYVAMTTSTVARKSASTQTTTRAFHILKNVDASTIRDIKRKRAPVLMTTSAVKSATSKKTAPTPTTIMAKPSKINTTPLADNKVTTTPSTVKVNATIRTTTSTAINEKIQTSLPREANVGVQETNIALLVDNPTGLGSFSALSAGVSSGPAGFAQTEISTTTSSLPIDVSTSLRRPATTSSPTTTIIGDSTGSSSLKTAEIPAVDVSMDLKRPEATTRPTTTSSPPNNPPALPKWLFEQLEDRARLILDEAKEILAHSFNSTKLNATIVAKNSQNNEENTDQFPIWTDF